MREWLAAPSLALAWLAIQFGGPSNNGSTWDGVLPFVGGNPGSLNETMWVRHDYALTQAAAHGITVYLNVATQYDFDVGCLNGKSTAQLTAYGTALANRYHSTPNLSHSQARCGGRDSRGRRDEPDQRSTTEDRHASDSAADTAIPNGAVR